MTETYKTYTVYPSDRAPVYGNNDYTTNYWGLGFFVMIGALFVICWVGYKIVEWWEGLGMPYGTSKPLINDNYYDYNTKDNDTTKLVKPKAHKWVNNIYKPKPVIPPRMFVAGRMNGVDYQYEGTEETKYLMQHERNRYYTQKGVSINTQDDIEAKWKKDPYNGA